MKPYSDTFKSSKAAKAAGITQDVMNQWVQRKLIHPAEAAPGQGAGATWDFNSIVKLRLMKVLVDAGMTRVDGGNIATDPYVSKLIEKISFPVIQKVSRFGFKVFGKPSLLSDSASGITTPAWLVVSKKGAGVVADWFCNDDERAKILPLFEQAESYTIVNLAVIINYVYSELSK